MKISIRDESSVYKAVARPLVHAGTVHYLLNFQPQPLLDLIYDRACAIQDLLIEQANTIDDISVLLDQWLIELEKGIETTNV